jgi:hypothetical protein
LDEEACGRGSAVDQGQSGNSATEGSRPSSRILQDVLEGKSWTVPFRGNDQVGGKTVTAIEPVKDGTDIQSTFFDMWRQEHPTADLQNVPGDMVTTSGSGLDPHITLENAEFQLDRVASKWAQNTKRDPAQLRGEIEQILQEKTQAPMYGLWGEKIVNVFEVNLELRKRYGAPPA